MKKIFLGLFILFLSQQDSHAQLADDRLVSAHLKVNTGDEKIVSFVLGFKSGLEKVKNRELASMDAITSYYGVDIRSFPDLQGQLAERPLPYVTVFTPAFLNQLATIVNGIGTSYQTIPQFRQALTNLAVSVPLRKEEAEALLMMDFSTQEIERQVPTSGTINQAGFLVKEKEDVYSYASKKIDATSFVFIQDDPEKLLKWVRCALGVLGSTILGTLNGIATGGQIGGLAGGAGAAAGATIGGIVGFISGFSNGISNYCD
jgi:hypothetical protein